MARLRWGIKTAPQHTTYEAMLAVWREADRTPTFEHAWLFDHFAPIQGDLDGPCFEGWTLLAALAAQTSRLRLGLMVAGNTYRHPAVHAKMAAKHWGLFLRVILRVIAPWRSLLFHLGNLPLRG